MIRSYVSLLQKEHRILAFGMLLTFFSSFGQTFFISLFVPAWEKEFALGSGTFGSLYSLATLMSAAVLPIAGRLVDTMDLRRFTLGVGAVLASGCAALSFAANWWHLLILLFALRLSGQGLCGHIASTTMARRFQRERGKALSISALGFPVGEGILPTLGIIALATWGWRTTSLVDGGIVVLVMMPIAFGLLSPPKFRQPPTMDSHATPVDVVEKEWTRQHVLRDWRFYCLLPGLLNIPFAVTGLIIHQVRLAEFKGWTMANLAFAFAGFAVARVFCSLLVGPAIDRWGARRIFPWIGLPMAFGIGLLLMMDSPWTALIYLSLMGGSMGLASGTGSALWAELYGVRHLGAIKSLGSSMAILGTALSPALFGWILGAGTSFHWILIGTIALTLLTAVVSLPVCLKKGL